MAFTLATSILVTFKWLKNSCFQQIALPNDSDYTLFIFIASYALQELFAVNNEYGLVADSSWRPVIVYYVSQRKTSEPFRVLSVFQNVFLHAAPN